MPQAERSGAGIRVEDARGDRRPQRLTDLGLRAFGDRGDQLLADGASGHRDDAEQALGRLRQGGDLARQGLGQRMRQPLRAAAQVGRHELLDEERVAVRARVDPGDLGIVRSAAEKMLDLARDVGPVEPREVQAGRPGVARETGQPRRDRMPTTEVVGPDREDEQQALAIQVAGKEGHEIARRAVDPVEVLEDQDDRRVRREVAEEPQEQAEQARLVETAARVGGLLRRPVGRGRARARLAAAFRGIADPRQEPSDLLARRSQDLVDTLRRQITEVAAERFGERAVRHPPVGEIEAAALQHERRTGPGSFCEFGDQPRLSDARLAGDDHDLRRAFGGAGQRGIERVRFERSPDEFHRRDRARHAAESTPSTSLRRARRYAEHDLRYPHLGD